MAAPVINSVTVNADGDFVVDFTAVIDKAAGAEYVMVSMCDSDGNEVSSVKVVGKNNKVVMTP